MAVKHDLSELLVIHLRDVDVQDQDAAEQIRYKLGFIVDTASISQLLIDLENVSFLSSSAIGQLIMLKKKCDLEEIALALCNISSGNMKVLRLVRGDEVLDIFPDQWTAIDSLRKTLLPAPADPLPRDEVEQLNKEAAEGDADAMYELAIRYTDGMGIPQDWELAIHWLRQAARLEHPDAQHELATCYAFGLGVPQSHVEATRWYEQAASLGQADSQYMLGMYFQYALGEISDVHRAEHWYQQAANQGNAKATRALRKLQNVAEEDTKPYSTPTR